MSENLKTSLDNLCRSTNKIYSVELCSNKELKSDLLSIQPLFYSVTWHFKKIASLNDIIKNPAMTIAINLAAQGKNILLHLPCRYLNKQNVFDILTIAKQNKINNIFALLGESIKSEQPTGDFNYAIELVRFIKEKFGNDFCICVAGYPERNRMFMKKLMHLKQKVQAGADFIITQVIFDTETFHKFYKSCREINVTVPIVPGLYLINSFDTVLSMAKICHVIIPENVLNYFQLKKDDNTALQKYGEELIHKLLANTDYPVIGVHIFSLNDVESVCNLTKNITFYQ